MQTSPESRRQALKERALKLAAERKAAVAEETAFLRERQFAEGCDPLRAKQSQLAAQQASKDRQAQVPLSAAPDPLQNWSENGGAGVGAVGDSYRMRRVRSFHNKKMRESAAPAGCPAGIQGQALVPLLPQGSVVGTGAVQAILLLSWTAYLCPSDKGSQEQAGAGPGGPVHRGEQQQALYISLFYSISILLCYYSAVWVPCCPSGLLERTLDPSCLLLSWVSVWMVFWENPYLTRASGRRSRRPSTGGSSSGRYTLLSGSSAALLACCSDPCCLHLCCLMLSWQRGQKHTG